MILNKKKFVVRTASQKRNLLRQQQVSKTHRGMVSNQYLLCVAFIIPFSLLMEVHHDRN
jgi:hypothetical protein